MNQLTMNDITITSKFWQNYRHLISDTVLPYQWSVMNDEADVKLAGAMGTLAHSKNSHVIENLRIAAGLSEGNFSGYPFQDTDAYKWLEAAAYTLNYQDNDELRLITDELINLISEAQEDDGYLVSYFQIEAPERRFMRLQQSHEHYTMGHYIEAGIAYYQVTGNQKALDIAIRMADCIANNFGEEEGKIDGYDGHPEIEIALARLYEVTQKQSYKELLEYFVYRRGHLPTFFDDQIQTDGFDREMINGMNTFPASYFQADVPLLDCETLEGHAVRVVYLCAGMAYLANINGDEALFKTCSKFWNNIVNKRMYITGGIGSTNLGEAFTMDYDLPNDTNYCETCASVGMVFFAQQMLEHEIESNYVDVIERQLYNGALAGMALDGKHFYYVNPLEADPQISAFNPSRSHVLTQRADWFGCACCPSNLARLIASVEKYVYSVTTDTLFINQYIASKLELKENVSVEQVNDYPWSGEMVFKISNPELELERLALRIPSWSKNKFSLSVNGQPLDLKPLNGYVYVDLNKADMTINLKLDFSVKIMKANPLVRSDYGKVTLQRGPLVYCTENHDNPDNLWTYHLSLEDKIEVILGEGELKDVVLLKAKAYQESNTAETALYYEASSQSFKKTDLIFIPYYTWANRSEGQMTVWQNVYK